jgi:ABC-type sugar transport system, permease component
VVGHRKLRLAVSYGILLFGALLILFPLYICVSTTFKTETESANSFFTLPQSLYFGNYANVLKDVKLGYAYLNTLIITVVTLSMEFLIMPPMSYAISRSMGHRKLYRRLYFFLLLGIFLPFQVRMMPLVKQMASLGLLNQIGVMLLYVAHATCESMFLYVGYLATVNRSLEEAAYIDGATTMQTYTRVILPLMKPILATVLIREGLAIWNDFQMPLIMLNRSTKMWTLTIYQYNFQSEFSVDYNLAFSCFVIASLPIIIFYIIMQKQIIGGLTSGAVKG